MKVTTPVYSQLADDPELGELVEMYIDEMPERIAALDKLIEKSDLGPLQQRAHQIKGSAKSYGFPNVSQLAAELEYSIRDKATRAVITEKFKNLRSAFESVRQGSSQQLD